MDLAVVLAIIPRKLLWPKLEQYPASKLLPVEECPNIYSLKQLHPSKSYLVFANQVYDLANL